MVAGWTFDGWRRETHLSAAPYLYVAGGHHGQSHRALVVLESHHAFTPARQHLGPPVGKHVLSDRIEGSLSLASFCFLFFFSGSLSSSLSFFYCGGRGPGQPRGFSGTSVPLPRGSAFRRECLRECPSAPLAYDKASDDSVQYVYSIQRRSDDDESLRAKILCASPACWY